MLSSRPLISDKSLFKGLSTTETYVVAEVAYLVPQVFARTVTSA